MLKSDEPETELTRDQRRSRRQRLVRARTVNLKRLSKTTFYADRALYPEDTKPLRPKTRAECINAVRPCPYVSCKHHLYLDVSEETGNVKLNFPDLEVWEMVESCALDVSDRGGVTAEQAAAILNLTRERVRQIEVDGLQQLTRSAHKFDLQEFVGSEASMPCQIKPRLHVVSDLNNQGRAPFKLFMRR